MHPQNHFRPFALILITDLEQRNGRNTDSRSAVSYLRSKGLKVDEEEEEEVEGEEGGEVGCIGGIRDEGGGGECEGRGEDGGRRGRGE